MRVPTLQFEMAISNWFLNYYYSQNSNIMVFADRYYSNFRITQSMTQPKKRDTPDSETILV